MCRLLYPLKFPDTEVVQNLHNWPGERAQPQSSPHQVSEMQMELITKSTTQAISKVLPQIMSRIMVDLQKVDNVTQ